VVEPRIRLRVTRWRSEIDSLGTMGRDRRHGAFARKNPLRKAKPSPILLLLAEGQVKASRNALAWSAAQRFVEALLVLCVCHFVGDGSFGLCGGRVMLTRQRLSGRWSGSQ
jgi:hypothetical protein